MLADQVQARLEVMVGDLAGRWQTAADLGELVRTGQLPQAPVAGYVVPSGLRATSGGESAAGAFTQALEEVVAVVLVLRTAGDARGGKSLVRLTPLIMAVVVGLCGWMPNDSGDEDLLPIGDFRLSRGQLVSMNSGTLIYQLEFVAPLQLRIMS